MDGASKSDCDAAGTFAVFGGGTPGDAERRDARAVFAASLDAALFNCGLRASGLRASERVACDGGAT